MFTLNSYNMILWGLLFLGIFILTLVFVLLIIKILELKRNLNSFGISQESTAKSSNTHSFKTDVAKDNIANENPEHNQDIHEYDESKPEYDEYDSKDLKENSKSFFKSLLKNVKEDKVPDLGAQTTFYLVLAMFPFLIFLLSILQFTPLDYATIVSNIEGLLPTEAQELIFDTLEEVFTGSSGTLLSFSVIGALWSSLKGAQGLIKAVNIAYNVEETRNFFHVKAVALLTTLGVPIMILIAFFFIVFGEVLGTHVFDFLGLSDNFINLWSLVRYPIPIITMILFFMLFYKYAPSKQLKFKNVFWGALFTVIFWLLASLGFSIYVNNFSSYSAVYGSLGSVVVVLLWLYISSIIIIVGGEVNVVLSRLRKGLI